jgi:hypothetical protein
LAVGLKYNAPLEDALKNPSLKQAGAAKFSEYRDRFLKEMGTVMCPEIQKKLFGRAYNLIDPQDHEEFLSTPGHQEKCAEAVSTATRIAAEMILADEIEEHDEQHGTKQYIQRTLHDLLLLRYEPIAVKDRRARRTSPAAPYAPTRSRQALSLCQAYAWHAE